MRGPARTQARDAKLFLAVFVISLAARLVFFAAMAHDTPASAWPALTPDAAHYTSAAQAICAHGDFTQIGVQIFGPGYPVWLALLAWLTGGLSSAALLLQILLSAVVSVLFALWALQLTGDYRIALVTGLLNALSLTGISMANIFLSETLFMALMSASAIVLLHAMNRQRYWLAAASGVLLGCAILTRSAGLGMPLVFLSLAFLPDEAQKLPVRHHLRARLKVALLCVAVACAILVGWSSAYRVTDSSFAFSVPGAMAQIVRSVDAQQQHITLEEASARFESECKRYAQDSGLTDLAALQRVSYRRFSQVVTTEPLTVLAVIWRNAHGNIYNEFSLLLAQSPRMYSVYDVLRIWLVKKGLNYRTTVLALLGAILLWRRKFYRVLAVLVLLYVYFAAVAGLSVNQTSRIFYPAQLAWGVLVSVALIWLYDKVRRHPAGASAAPRAMEPSVKGS